jgi:dihydroorotase
MNSGMKNMLDIMSKYLNMGMTIQDIIFRATWNSANSIKRPDLGQLSEGADADLAILNVRKGKFGFVDAGGASMAGESKFEAEMTIRAGKIVWDQNGLAAHDWTKK